MRKHWDDFDEEDGLRMVARDQLFHQDYRVRRNPVKYYYAYSAFADEWDVKPKKLAALFNKNALNTNEIKVKEIHAPYRGHLAIGIFGNNKKAILMVARALGEYTYIGKPKLKDITTSF